MIIALRCLLGLLLLASVGLSPAAAQLMPPIFPLQPVPEPVENPITEAKRVLGKILFWDEQLSSDNTVACGTCHRPANGGSDPRTGAHPGLDGVFGTADDVVGSRGVIRSDLNNAYEPDPVFGLGPQVTGRSTPTFIGAQWSPELFWDGRATDQFVDPSNPATVRIATGGALESQAVAPIVSPAEMGHVGRDWPEVITKLATVTPLKLATNVPPDMANALAGGASYTDLFTTAFGDPQISATRIAFAIATYERTLVPDQTPWDLFIAGNTNALTPNQQAGWSNLYNSTVCLNCHTPPNFTDDAFHNIGLRPSAEDLGREFVTGSLADRGRFKTPTLRNVGLRPRLMHVGWITDVQDSIDFYNAGSQTGTGHVQFTAQQTGIPTSNPNFFANYDVISMPAVFQARIIDFLVNGLTDPRVANETFPFDRPTLYSEQAAINPSLFGTGSVGTGGFTPAMIAVTPPNLLNPDFKIGVTSALGGSVAYLALSLAATPPGTMLGGLPLHVDFAPQFLLLFDPVPLLGTGPGAGYGTFPIPIPGNPAFAGLNIYGQLAVIDSSGASGLAVSQGANWTLF